MKTKNQYSEQLTVKERTLLEDMKELLIDAELIEEFEDSVWLKVDTMLWSEIKNKMWKV
jgi:hypothetical protein